MFKYAGIAVGFVFALFYLGKRYARKFARTLDSAKDPENVEDHSDF